MEYSQRFSGQWTKLAQSLKSHLLNTSSETITRAMVQDWYDTNSFRWSSICENEGILLADENNDNLRTYLLDGISAFSFSSVTRLKKPNFIPYCAIGVVASAAVGFGLSWFLHLSIWWIIPAVFILMGIAIGLYASKLDKHEAKQVAHFSTAYVSQLLQYENKLMDICKRYEKQKPQ